MPNSGFRQDMPPAGGYGPITYERIPLKKPLSGLKLFSIWIASTTFGFYCYYLNKQMIKKRNRENDDATVALEPLLIAERDRMFLNQLRKNREEEAKLMKNVPGWKVGTLYGEPLYKTIDKNRMLDPCVEEYYAHDSGKAELKLYTFADWF